MSNDKWLGKSQYVSLFSSVVNKDLTFKAKAKDLSLDLKDKFKDCSLLLQLQRRRRDLMQEGHKN